MTESTRISYDQLLKGPEDGYSIITDPISVCRQIQEMQVLSKRSHIRRRDHIAISYRSFWTLLISIINFASAIKPSMIHAISPQI